MKANISEQISQLNEKTITMQMICSDIDVRFLDRHDCWIRNPIL